ncbi:MAG: hypothetical protein ACKO24_04955 [Leptolyngbyaceae cyanobacterium]
MIISEIDHVEEVSHASDAIGGWMGPSFGSPFSQSLHNLTTSSAAIINYGSGSLSGNTAISYSFSMPLMVVINTPTARMSSRSSLGLWGASSGRGRITQNILMALLFQSFFGDF